MLATTNRGKLADFARLFADTGLSFSLPEDHGVQLDVEETGTTFAANALLKAEVTLEATGLASLADDSGLAVDALGGAPGVYSARYAGPACDDHANNRKVIVELAKVAPMPSDGAARLLDSGRGAAFVCALVLALPDGRRFSAAGECRGFILDQERGSNGFGYDSLFLRADLGCTFGEATPEQKNTRSHRAAAVKALLEDLRRNGLLPR